MYVVIKKNCYGYDDGGYSVANVFGPFVDSDAARAYIDAQDEQYAVEYDYYQIQAV